MNSAKSYSNPKEHGFDVEPNFCITYLFTEG